MRLEALIFDVDGTLADTEEAHRVAFNLAFERHRLDWSWSRSRYRELLQVSGGLERLLAHMAGLGVSAEESRRLRALAPAVHAEKTKFYTAMLNDGAVPLRTGVGRLLDESRLAGAQLALVSSSTAASVDALLRSAVGARRGAIFDVVVCGDDVQPKKPAPLGYRLALQRLALPAAAAIAFEDSAHGLAAATAAGLRTVVTPNYWTEMEDFSGAWQVLAHLGDPGDPLPGEPGRQLASAGWLTFAELGDRVAADVHPA
jgi:HAD superfamily hydrolase (TIGR01509 family)